MAELKFIEPELIKAGDNRVRLGYWQEAPKLDCRVISEDNYQLLKQAYDKISALAENTPSSSEQCATPAVVKRSELLPCERCKKLEFMIEHGLGWKDMENDCT